MAGVCINIRNGSVFGTSLHKHTQRVRPSTYIYAPQPAGFRPPGTSPAPQRVSGPAALRPLPGLRCAALVHQHAYACGYRAGGRSLGNARFPPSTSTSRRRRPDAFSVTGAFPGPKEPASRGRCRITAGTRSMFRVLLSGGARPFLPQPGPRGLWPPTGGGCNFWKILLYYNNYRHILSFFP